MPTGFEGAVEGDDQCGETQDECRNEKPVEQSVSYRLNFFDSLGRMYQVLESSTKSKAGPLTENERSKNVSIREPDYRLSIPIRYSSNS